MNIGKYKGLAFFAIVFLMCSCHNIERKNGQPVGGSGLWDISDSTVRIHTYNRNGLADSTLEIWYDLQHGRKNLSVNTLVTRIFDDKGKLIEERNFGYLKKSGTWELDGRTVQKYDLRGNIVLHVETDIKNSKSRLSRLVKSVYDQKNKEVLRFELRRRIELEPDWNIDSALAHADDDLKSVDYDTVIVSFTYDREGNLLTQSYGRPAESMVTTTYSHGVREADFCLDAEGDTTVIYRYEREGDLVRKVRKIPGSRLNSEMDTCWYKGDKIVKRVDYDHKMHTRQLQMYWYDGKGNEIGRARYR